MAYQERDIISAEDMAIAYAEMQLAGHIEYFADGERFRFTDTGLDAAWELWYNLPAKDRLSLFLLTKLITETYVIRRKEEPEEYR